MLVAGDIGGTKTILALFSLENGPRQPLAEATFPSLQYDGLADIVREFLVQTGQRASMGSFGVAGPVVDGRAKVTNLPWIVDREELKRELGLETVSLWNDLEIIAASIPILEPADLYTINDAKPVPHGAIAVLAPGTGLGEAYLTWNGQRYQPHPSEGGHADFAPTDSVQVDLLQCLMRKHGHVSYERVCSGGLGIPAIYNCLKEYGYAQEPAWLAEKLAAADNPTPIIVNAGLDRQNPCELCVKTVEVFISVMAAEAANLALKVLARGGVYLGGGIPPRILPALDRGRFMRAFTHKGRMSELLASMPVHVIINPKAGLFGSARLGFEEQTVPEEGTL